MEFTQMFKPWFENIPINAKKANVVLAEGVSNKEITIEYDFVGTEGNSFSVEVVAGSGNDVDLSAVLSETKITVTLGTDGTGALDATKNTATLIVAELNTIDNFTATVDGTGAEVYSVAITEVNFANGQYATPAMTTCVIIISDVWYITKGAVDKWDEDGWYSATPSLIS